jgi:DNA-binding PadR family transcriptional regulator
MTATATEAVSIEHNGHVIKSDVQIKCLKMLKKRPSAGYTSREIEDAYDLDHGKVSGALSVLHKRGILALLAEKRDGFMIYVLTEFVKGRQVKARKS